MVWDWSRVFLQSKPQCWSTGCVPLPPPTLFFLQKLETQQRPLQVVLCWSGGGPMWSIGSHFSYPLNAVCLSLCGTGKAFDPFLFSRILSVVSWSWIGVSCSREGKQSQEPPDCHLGDIALLHFFILRISPNSAHLLSFIPDRNL